MSPSTALSMATLLPCKFFFHNAALYSAVALSCAVQIASTASVVTVAASQVIPSSSREVATAASIFDTVGLLSTITASLLYLRRVSRTKLVMACGFFISLATSAAVLTLYTFGRTLQHRQQHPYTSLHGVMLAGIVTASVAVVSQTLLYALILWPQAQRPETRERRESDDTSGPPSPVRSLKRKLSVHLTAFRPFELSVRPTSGAASTTATIGSSEPGSARSSFRHSLKHVVRPVTSRSRLIRGTSAWSRSTPNMHSSRHSRSIHRDRDDDFGDWDVTNVEHLDSMYQTWPLKTPLEPIPGSRSVSPARLLETVLPPPTSPLPSPHAPSPTYSAPQHVHSAPTSRRPSRGDQSHIHPLFRTESPVPPPTASPGTIITASPYARQVVSPDHAFSQPRTRSSTLDRPILSPRPSFASRPSTAVTSPRPSIPSRPGSSRDHGAIPALPKQIIEISSGIADPSIATGAG